MGLEFLLCTSCVIYITMRVHKSVCQFGWSVRTPKAEFFAGNIRMYKCTDFEPLAAGRSANFALLKNNSSFSTG